MGSLGSMVADLSLNYGQFLRGLAVSSGGMNTWQAGAATWLNTTANIAGRAMSGIGAGAAGATRATGAAVGNILRGTGDMARGFGAFGQSSVMSYLMMRGAQGQAGAASARYHESMLSQQQQQRSSLSATSAAHISLGVVLGGLASRIMGMVSSVPSLGLKLASDAEQAQISFEVMLGSADKAKHMLGELKAYADKSPFNLAGVTAYGEKLLNYSMQAQDVMPTIRMLGDVAAGNQEKFDRLSTAFGQTTSTGRLMGQDLLQFINAGFNPLQEISKKTGESMAALKKRMEEGGISALEVRNAFVSATSEGGRFYQMTDRQSKTIAGKWSTLKDGVSTALRGIGEAMITNLDLGGWIDYLTGFVNRVPFLFSNAGTLLHAEILNWNVYVMELVPGAEDMIVKVGAVLSAGWDAMGASYHKFFESVKAGFIEMGNLAQASKNATGAALWAPLQTAHSWGTNATGGLLGKAKEGAWNPLHMFGTAGDAWNKTLASQPDAMKPGEDFASTFAKTFNESLKKAEEGAKGTSLSETLKKQRDDMLWAIAEGDSGALPANVDLGGAVGASFTGKAEEKDKKEKSAAADRDTAAAAAAMRGSSEAAKIMTAGIAGGSIQQKQLTTLERIAKAVEAREIRRGEAMTIGLTVVDVE